MLNADWLYTSFAICYEFDSTDIEHALERLGMTPEVDGVAACADAIRQYIRSVPGRYRTGYYIDYDAMP